MIFLRLWNYFNGYVVIRIDGLSLEKFINLAVSRGIYIWKINRSSYTSMTACIGIEGFRELHAISHKIKFRVRILDKRGFPFVAYRYKHRKMLIGGMLVFLLILYGFSSFIWTVHVEGTDTINTHRIVEELDTIGLRPGTFKRNIDTLHIENRLIINVPEISWASLEIRGSKAIVRVAEAVLPPAMVDKDTPANILAKRDGIIHEMIVLEGDAVVEIGQTVKEGQLLVSGIIDHPDTSGIRYVHSMGQIMARTWYEGVGYISYDQPISQRTGRTKTKKYLSMADIKIPFGSDNIEFTDYELEVREEDFFPKGQFLPVKMIIEEYHEVEFISISNDSDISKEKAEDMAWKDADKKIPSGAKVIDKKFKYDIIEGEGVSVVVYVETLEDIGTQQAIVVHR